MSELFKILVTTIVVTYLSFVIDWAIIMWQACSVKEEKGGVHFYITKPI